jgi:hypothetical protein
LASSPFNTPITLRQVQKSKKNIEDILQDQQQAVDPALAVEIRRLAKAAESNTAELIQVKRDLGRTKYAERVQKRRKAVKNTPLQSGGVLTVTEARRIVVQKEEDQLAKARRLVEAAEKKLEKQHKRWYFEAAKEARKWRMNSRLAPVELYESGRPICLVKIVSSRVG